MAVFRVEKTKDFTAVRHLWVSFFISSQEGGKAQ